MTCPRRRASAPSPRPTFLGHGTPDSEASARMVPVPVPADRYRAKLAASVVLALWRPSWQSPAERNQDGVSFVLKGYRLDANACFGVVYKQ